MLDIEAVGQNAEEDAGCDIAELVDREDHAGPGVAHIPFQAENGEYRGVVDEDQHDEELAAAEQEQPARIGADHGKRSASLNARPAISLDETFGSTLSGQLMPRSGSFQAMQRSCSGAQ